MESKFKIWKPVGTKIFRPINKTEKIYSSIFGFQVGDVVRIKRQVGIILTLQGRKAIVMGKSGVAKHPLTLYILTGSQKGTARIGNQEVLEIIGRL